jgi:hypothetical protein
VSRCRPVALAFALVFTTSGLDAAAQSGSDSSPAMTPGQVVRAFYAAAAENRLPEARRHMSPALIATLPQSGGLAKVCTDRIGPVAMRGVQIVREQVDGPEATVSLRLHLVDGSTKDQQEMLVKENGEWKIGVQKTARK